MRSLICLCASFLIISFASYAEEPLFPEHLVLEASLDKAFPAEKVFFFVHLSTTEGFVGKTGVLLPVGSDPESFPRALFPLRQSEVEEGLPLRSIAYFVSRDGEIETSSVTVLTVETLEENQASLSSIQKELESKEQSLKSFIVQRKEQQRAIDRLQADLGVIGNFHKAVQLERQALEIESDLVETEKQEQAFRALLTGMKKQKKPAQYALQKRALEGALASTREALQQVKARSEDEKKRTESQFLDDLSLIELTRDQDLEQLRDELFRLRNVRQEQEVSPTEIPIVDIPVVRESPPQESPVFESPIKQRY